MITPRRRVRETFLPFVQLAVDAASIYLVLNSVFWFRFASGFFKHQLGEADYPFYTNSFFSITLILIFFLRSYGLYKPARFFTFIEEAGNVVKAVAISTIILMAVTFFIREFSFSRTFFIMAGAVLAAGISLGRFLLGLVVMWADKKRGSPRNILIVGANEHAAKLVQFYRKNPRLGTHVLGFLDDHRKSGELVEGIPVLGASRELGDYVRSHREVHEIVLAAQGVSPEAVLRMLSECEKLMVTFRWIADIFGLIASRMSVSYSAGMPLLSFVDSPLVDWENRVLKRGVDILLSFSALFFLSPIFLIVAALVKADSPGRVFFGQQRIGEDGRRFALFKFRTMRVGAERETGPVWAKENDPRRTRIGGFLRKSNLDELPQLWNVLRGDMSLVGPRPERPFFVSRFKEDIPRYMARHSIRSGITGWAQVNGLRGNTSIEERTKFDLYYIENWSLWFDVKILARTFFSNRNAY